jgi:ferrochelatase
MAHGTPSSLEDMPEYLQLVRGGRPPSPELVAEMRRNYEAIGGRSPLTDITMAQGAALQARLGSDIPVGVGMRSWRPFIKDALASLAGQGVTRVVGIPLAPQYSTVSVQKYVDVARASLPDGMSFDAAPSFHAHPLLLDAFADRVRAAGPQPAELVVFTAHSVPTRVVDAGDRYPVEVSETARGVAERAGISSYQIAYQSAGRTPEPCVGPTLADTIRDRAEAGRTRFLVVPIGFVCDHTEVLFDIDIEAAALAREHGAQLRRTESLNTSGSFIAMLEDLVRRML